MKSASGGAVTYSVYSSLTGQVAVIDNAATGERLQLLSLGPVSVRVPATGAAVYTHLDHLGSPVAATDTAGAVLWRESFTPYGARRINPAANRDKPGFTGHVDDDATGLTYMQARYYDPALGRFLSNDPVGFTPGRPDMFNRYAYAANDPVNNWDPDGMDSISCTQTSEPSNEEGVMDRQIVSCTVRRSILPVTFLRYQFINPDGSAFYHPLASKQSPFSALGKRSTGEMIEALAELTKSRDASQGMALPPAVGRVIQSGGRTISNRVARELGVSRREAGRALEALKKDLRLPNNHHGKITSEGYYLDDAGNILGNLKDYL